MRVAGALASMLCALALAACSPREDLPSSSESDADDASAAEVEEESLDEAFTTFDSSEEDDDIPTPDESAPIAFERQLSFGDTGFTLKAYGREDRKLLVVQASRGGQPLGDAARVGIDGDVVNATATDLDGDEAPEVLVFARSREGMRRGAFAGFVLADEQLLALTMPGLSARQAAGYRGGDTFSVEASQVVRRFPVFEGTDDQPTAKVRAIRYSLERGGDFVVESTEG